MYKDCLLSSIAQGRTKKETTDVWFLCASADSSFRLSLALILLTFAANAELYCKLGLPFVMGTTGGDRQLLYKSVQDSNNYALISPQMGKQVL